MKVDNVRKAAELIVVLDHARDWLKTFKEDKQAVIVFDDITGRPRLDGMGEGRGWEGHLAIPRGTAIAMMEWLESRTVEALTTLRVEVDT